MMLTVIGAGLAGCEAALQAAKRGVRVLLVECKPAKRSPAHRLDTFAELVCSNSLKSDDPFTASGVLKNELRALNCALLEIADRVRVPAGSALAVDRALFSNAVTDAVRAHPGIEIVDACPDGWDENEYTIIATGPLTVGGLAARLAEAVGGSLHFYDAAAPVVDATSIDESETFSSSRYGKGSDDYINCPLHREAYYEFVSALVSAEKAELHDFDKREIFEGCMPVEVMAGRGADTLRYGPLRPVGFIDPRTGRRPFAVVQLRAENAQKTMYNLVGFQTNLKFPEQKRVFRMIPALKNAEFLRYGVMHRNTYIDAPKVLTPYFSLKNNEKTFICGQLCGVEGYVESIAAGLMAGINAAAMILGRAQVVLPSETIIGSLSRYVTSVNDDFQPMNANFGILPPLDIPERDKQRRKARLSQRSADVLQDFINRNHLI